MRLRIGEAVHLQPTCAATRHAALFGKVAQSLDPYIVVKVDEYRVGQTRTKHRTNSPTYNEEFSTCVSTSTTLELAVFHDAPIGYDQFIANCTIRFQDLMETTSTEETFEGWDRRTFAVTDLFLDALRKGSYILASACCLRTEESLYARFSSDSGHMGLFYSPLRKACEYIKEGASENAGSENACLSEAQFERREGPCEAVCETPALALHTDCCLCEPSGVGAAVGRCRSG
ncbi:hypothetical protein AOLI_G00014470 [Acnodon oligacanthus]